MDKTELVKLVDQRDTIIEILNQLEETIQDNQIIVESQMNLLGFIKTAEQSPKVVYAKKKDDVIYEVVFNLTDPNWVAIHRQGQSKVYGFEIVSIDDFRNLLNFVGILAND